MKAVLFGLFLATAVLCTDRQAEIDHIISLVQDGTSPAQLLVSHIDGLILSIRQEQLGHEDIFAVQQKECNEELGFRNEQIAAANDAGARATERRNRCNTALVLARADLSSMTRYQTLFYEDQQNSRQRREEEATAARRILDNFRYALETIDMAEAMVNEWASNQGSFVQLVQKMNQVFVQGAKNGFTNEVTPILAVLAEVQQSGNVSQDMAERLRTLLHTIREKILAAMADVTEQENYLIEIQQARKERNARVLELIEALLQHLRDYINENQRCVTANNDIINAATAKRVRNQQVKDYTVSLCDAYNFNIQGNSKDRNSAIDMLQKLRKFVLAKAAEFGTYDGVEVEYIFTGRRDASFVQLAANLRSKL